MRPEKHTLFFSILVIVSVFLLKCSRENDYDFPVDTEAHRKDSITLNLINSLNSDSIKSTALWLQQMGTRFALAENRRTVALRIRDRFRRFGYQDARLDSFMISVTWRHQNYSMWQYNVIAELHGSVHPDSLIILGAHYDDILSAGDPFTTVPGANDNASGVAAMIEAARVMKKKNYSPSISVQFAGFAAEELGLLGSADYAAKLALSGRPVRFMINNDMIAYETAPVSSSWSVKLHYYDNSTDLLPKAKDLCSKYAGITGIPDTTDLKRSDSYSFYRKNFNAIYFASKTSDTNYHTINDIVLNCNFRYCREVTGLAVALIVNSE